MSLPHTDIGDSVFVRADSPEWHAADQTFQAWLANLKVIVLEDDPSFDYAESLGITNVVVQPSVIDALRLLASGEGDCALLPSRTGLLLIDQLRLSNLQILPTELNAYSRGLSFGVRSQDKEALQIFEQGLMILTSTRSYLDIYNRWERWTGRDAWSWKQLMWVLMPILLLLGLSGAWTWSLRRTVAARTAQLHQEMAERRLLEAHIQQSQKLESLGVLAGGIAHDFNNLLMGILGNASLALVQIDPDSPLRDRLSEIQLAGRRAADLCRQMLAYSGKGRFVVRPFDLSKLVQEMTDLLHASVSKKTQLQRNLDPALPAVEGDVTQIRQVIMNLVINASEALDDQPGVVSVTTRAITWPGRQLHTAMLGDQARGHGRHDEAAIGEALLNESVLGAPSDAGDYVVLDVEDTGSGMDTETVQRIFEPFFSTKFTGRGLGLAATLGIVRGHKGSLEVDSEPGRGTTFRVYLPASDCVVESEEDTPSVEVEASSVLVLVVDDEESVRKITREILEEAGYQVLLADNGAEAIDLFRRYRQQVAAIVLDITMPEIDGVEAYRQLRDDDENVPVLFTSGYDERQALARLDQKSSVRFLQKPYEPPALLRSVAEILADQTTH